MGLLPLKEKNKGGGGKIRRRGRKKGRRRGERMGGRHEGKEEGRKEGEKRRKGEQGRKGKVEDRNFFFKSVKEVLCLRQLSHTERLKSNQRHTQHLCHLIFGLLLTFGFPKHLDL